MATAVAGFALKGSEETSIALEHAPRLPIAETHAVAALTGHGYSADHLKTLLDLDRFPLLRRTDPDLAMWAKIQIPRGIHNYPQPKFQVRNAVGDPFAFRVAWVSDAAYLLIWRGYPERLRHATATVTQGDRIVARLDLPALPFPALVRPPNLIPAWHGLSVVRCRDLVCPPSAVALLVSADLQPGDSLVAFTTGSSACAREAADSARYIVQAPGMLGPAVVLLPVNYPKTTGHLYLEVWETRNSAIVSAGPLRSVRSGEIVRKARLAVPLDRIAPAPPTGNRRAFMFASTLPKFGAAGRLPFQGRGPG